MKYSILFLIGSSSLLSTACADSDETLEQKVSSASEESDFFRGGRLYDRFYREDKTTGFTPDSAETSELDGSGGPNDDGTLLDSDGKAIDNGAGHGYRLKNFFGWDMRGTAGVYGEMYQNKSYAVAVNLIDGSRSRSEIADLVINGAPGVPAFGSVLGEQSLADLVGFIVAVNEHRLPQPSDIWDLSADAPKNYTLKSGADVEAGHAKITASCGTSACHGADGTKILFDDGEHSLGTLVRAAGYEAWFKIMVGHPDSSMGSQLDPTASVELQSKMILDVLAALCDIAKYPAGAATVEDVIAGDVRCGTYLQ